MPLGPVSFTAVVVGLVLFPVAEVRPATAASATN